MKGFISYYQFARHLILTPTNSPSNLLLNLQHDSPQPVSVLSAPENNLVASDFAYFHTIFESQTSHLICSVPLQGSNDRSYSFFSSTVEHWHLIPWVFFCCNSSCSPTTTISYSPRCWREPFSRCEEIRFQKCIFSLLLNDQADCFVLQIKKNQAKSHCSLNHWKCW